MKNWKILSKRTKNQELKTEEIIKILLSNRGLTTKKQIEEFLNPASPSTLDPKSLGIKKVQLSKAVKRIKKAIAKRESIIVYSDYDADGICGTAILWETLTKLGAHALPYVPHRVNEGYGLSKKGIENILATNKPSLIITVDHGITAKEKIDYAWELGIEVIVTDHHLPPKKLPQATALVHTTLLSGAAVAWILAQALNAELKSSIQYLDLVALATIADMVPLTSANRILVKYGLEELNKTERVGLKELIAEAGLKKGEIGTYEVGYILAPRLNATGRLTHGLDSLRLLCTKDQTRAEDLAKKLGMTNRERQKLMKETLSHAKDLLHEKAEGQRLIFISHESYQQGVIGLVAGKLVEEFYRPTVVVSKGEMVSKASARSINGFNIIEAIRKTADLLVDCGGHPMAAGFTIETQYLEMVQKKLQELAEIELNEEKLTKVLKIDCEINLAELTWQLYEKIQEFSPFGLGNPEPVFASRNVMVTEARTMGADNQHLKLRVTSPASPLSFFAVAFGKGEWFSKLSPPKIIDIAYTLSVDNWNREKELQLKLKDLRFSQ